METRSSYVLVGAVTLAIALALFGMVLWLAKFSGAEKRQFDVFFKQSVSGLAVGSAVAFKGVPVGQIKSISLLPKTPDQIRVRIEVGADVPILRGTTAGIEGVGFTGVSQIQLTGAISNAPPITEEGPFGVPVIPQRPGAIGELLATAPELLNHISDLTDSLNKLLNNDNRASIGGILKNTNRLSAALADRGPEIAATLAETRQTLAAATGAAQSLSTLVKHTDQLVTADGKPLVQEMHATIAHANATLAKIEGVVGSAQPGIDALTTQTLPEAGALVRDLRQLTTQLGAFAGKLDQDPAGAIVGGRRLPEYSGDGSTKKKGK